VKELAEPPGAKVQAEPQAAKVDSDRIDEAVDIAVAGVQEFAGGLRPTKPIDVIIGIACMVAGAGMLVWALGPMRPAGSGHAMNPALAAGGVIVGAIGYLSLAVALKWGERALRAGYYVLLLTLVLAFNLAVFAAGLEALRGMSIGSMNGEELARVACVAFDLYIASSLFRAVLRETSPRLARKRHRLARAAVSIVAALALHFTGALDALYTRLGMTPPGAAASIGVLAVEHLKASAPELPLEDFAGAWSLRQKVRRPAGGFVAGWITRVDIRVAGGRATAQLWWSCSPQPCDPETFQGKIESRHRGRAQALHFTGRTTDMDFLVTLTPQGEFLQLREQRTRHLKGGSTFYNTASLRRGTD
jgi:hypothetical protein